MNKVRKFTAVFLMLLLTLPLILAGCDNDDPKGPADTRIDQETMGYYSPNITVSYARPWFGNMVSTLYEKGWNIEDNNWTRSIKQNLGINLKLEWVLEDSSEYFVKMNNAIVTNIIPDFMNVHVGTDAYRLIKTMHESDMLENIWPYYEQYGSAELKDIYNSCDPDIFYPATFNGEVKAFPTILGSENDSLSFWWIRGDWLEALNLPVPEDMDDLVEVIKQFHDKDPDGDGEANSFGIPFADGFMSYLSPFFNGYHAYLSQWIENEEGDLVYSNVQPENKEVLAILADLYRGGYIEEGFNAFNNSIAISMLYQNKAGIWPGYVHNGMGLLQTTINNNPDAYYIPLRLLSCDSDPARPQAQLDSYQYFVVKKGSEHPEVLIKLFNYYLYISNLDDGDEFYTDMIQDENGSELWQFSPVNTAKPGQNFERAKRLRTAIESGDTSGLIGVDKDVYSYISSYLNDSDLSNWGWNSIYGIDGSEYLMGEYLENDMYMKEKFNGAPTDTMQEKKADLYTLEVAAYTAIIMGEQPIDYFDVFVEEWMNAGGRDITREVNEWYDSVVTQ